MSLNTYTGEWNEETASHLLRRTSYSTSKSQVVNASIEGMEATVDKVLTLKSEIDLPLNYNFDNDPNVAIGESWVNAGYSGVQGEIGYRKNSFAGWVIAQMMKDSVSIQEKLAVFWHNHFVVANINDMRHLYKYYNLLRENSLGDFKQLAKDITVDACMLRYLNGNQNRKGSPNENYARELLELFTIGKGPNVGDGDYTNYTEQDVQEIAKVLTGWRDTGFLKDGEVGSQYFTNRHDTTTKKLSHRFDNIEIPNAEENEYKNLIDIIFQKEEVSKFIVKKLYRWFVHYNITEEIESDIILPLAQILRDNDYVIKSVLEVLFKSEHFYTGDHVGCMIKNPLDYILNTLGNFELNQKQQNLAQDYKLMISIFEGVSAIQMNLFNHPTVAGWKAYYQEPVYYRIWLNSVTLPLRKTIQDILWSTGIKVTNSKYQNLDPFKTIEWVSNPLDINVIIKEVSDFIFHKPLTDSQMDYLKNVVLQGLPDFEWTVEYGNYLAEPDNEDIKNAIDLKLRLLFLSMCQLPEIHLS